MGYYWKRADYTPAPTFRRRIVSFLRRRRPEDAPDLTAAPRAGRIREEDRRGVLLRRSPVRWGLALAAWGWLAWAVVTAAEPMAKRFVAGREDLGYRQWLGRNMGGGYRSIYDRRLVRPTQK